MKFHAEILSPKQRSVLRRLSPILTEEGFYLDGGTAVALHLGHRGSADFDWFTSGRIQDPMVLARTIQDHGIALEVEQVARGTLHAQVSGVRVTLLEYRYPLIEPAIAWPEYGCLIASLPDLAGMKLSAIAQRDTKRDFVDIYALLRAGLSLAAMLDHYRRKFSVNDTAHILYGLTYFDDADRERMPRMQHRVTWNTVKRLILDHVNALTRA